MAIYNTSRFLRVIGEDGSTEDPQEDSNLSEYSTRELTNFFNKIGSELERRKQKIYGNVKVHWKGKWNGDMANKKPYLALMAISTNPNDEKYDYKFLKMNRIRYKAKDGYTITYDGYLKEGSILRGREEMGCDHYYRVNMVLESGLEIIGDSEARKLMRESKIGSMF